MYMCSKSNVLVATVTRTHAVLYAFLPQMLQRVVKLLQIVDSRDDTGLLKETLSGTWTHLLLLKSLDGYLHPTVRGDVHLAKLSLTNGSVSVFILQF